MTELAKLDSLWPAASRGELLSAFPNRTWYAIQTGAKKRGLHRIKKLVDDSNELRDEIRKRALEDGIPLLKLGAETHCGKYFAASIAKGADLNKIGRAVEFFGGKLVIDWQDK